MVNRHIVFFFACALLLSIGCEEKIKPSVLGGVSGAALPSQESWNTTVTFTDSGIVKAILKAGHIAAFETSKQTQLDSGVHVDFFDEHGVHSSVLTSRTGKVDENTNNLEAIGNVVVVSDSASARLCEAGDADPAVCANSSEDGEAEMTVGVCPSSSALIEATRPSMKGCTAGAPPCGAPPPCCWSPPP